jgi:hypothetical protein
MEDIVITYNGRSEIRENCVFIRGKFFHKDRDCCFYNGIYYSPLSRYLVVDHETKTKTHLGMKKLSFGIISGSTVDDFEVGYFSQNILKNGYLLIPSNIKEEKKDYIISAICKMRELLNSDSDEITRDLSPASKDPLMVIKCLNVDNLMANNDTLVNSKNSDVILSKNDAHLYTKVFKSKPWEKSARTPYEFELAYNAENMMDKFQDVFSVPEGGNSEKIRILQKYIKDYTFGIEYETWDGRIPTFECAKAGLIPIKDGSLRHDGICGYEYATVVMGGSGGLSTIKKQCELLSEYTTFNEMCSMHIHIGNIPKTKENLCKLYKAFWEIQSSLYSLFPICLRNTADYKGKNYCSPLPGFNFTPDNIVNFLGDGRGSFEKFGLPHPKDPLMNSKWHIDSRYKIVNFNNFYFTKRGTVELRISTPTFNHNKVIALLIIMCLIIESALASPNCGKYYKDIASLVCETVDEEWMKKWLLNYISYRQNTLNGYVLIGNSVSYEECMMNDHLTNNKDEIC